MFCSECGTKNLPENLFCNNCGHKLSDRSSTGNFSQKASKVKKGWSAGQKFIFIITVTLIAAGIVSYYTGKYLTSPEKTAKNYVGAVVAKNYSELYSYINVPDNLFTSKDFFVKTADKISFFDTKDEITKLTVKKPNDDIENGLKAIPQSNDSHIRMYFDIVYTTKGSNVEQLSGIELIKSTQRKWLIFDKWDVSADNLVANDYKITVPANTKIYLDGIMVDDELASREKDNDLYVIPKIFACEYQLKAVLPYANENIKEIRAQDNGSVTVSDFVLTMAAHDQLRKKALSDINEIYGNAIDNKSFDEIKKLFEDNKAVLKNAETQYNTLKGSISKEGNRLKKIEFTPSVEAALMENAAGGPETVYLQGNRAGISVSYDYKYTMDTYSKTSPRTIVEYVSPTAKTGRTTINYLYIDGKWVQGGWQSLSLQLTN